MFWHRVIGDDHVGLRFEGELLRGDERIVEGGDVEARVAQDCGNRIGNRGIIVDRRRSGSRVCCHCWPRCA